MRASSRWGRARERRRVGRTDPAWRLAQADQLVELGRADEALAIYDELLAHPDAHLDAHPDAASGGEVPTLVAATTRFNKATTLAEVGRPGEALTVYAELLTGHDLETTVPVGVHAVLFNARYNQAATLAELGNLDEAIAAYDELLTQHERHRRAGAGELADAARLNRAGLLARQARPDEALAAYDGLLTRTDDPPLPHQDVAAGVNKAILLAELGRPGEALITYDALLATYGAAHAESWLVAAARGKRAALLAELNRPEEALAGYDELLARHHNPTTPAAPGDSAEPERRGEVLGALLAKGQLLERLDRVEEAATVYDQVVAEHTREPTARSREPAAVALRRTSGVLDQLGRHSEAVAAYGRAEGL